MRSMAFAPTCSLLFLSTVNKVLCSLQLHGGGSVGDQLSASGL